MKGAISEQHKQFSCWYATFSVSYLHTETQKSTCTHPRYCSPSPITVPYCFHYSQLEQRMKKMLFFFSFKKGGTLKNSWDMHGVKRFWDDQQRLLKDFLWHMCVKVQVCSVSAGLRWRPTGRLTVCPHIALLHCASIHARCHLSSSPPTVFPGMPSKPIQAGHWFLAQYSHFSVPCDIL